MRHNVAEPVPRRTARRSCMRPSSGRTLRKNRQGPRGMQSCGAAQCTA
nr:MAG TPA: hypothetical protein [Caudoviricetes sp.]